MITDVPPLPTLVLAAVAAYLIGSIPVAYIAGRLNGRNVFEVGSRQAGATNVWREISVKAGSAVFLADFLKGAAAIMVARLVGLEGAWIILAALAVVLGHWNSIFTHFRGGDGVSTFAGVALAVAPVAVLLPFAVAAVVSYALRTTDHPSLWAGLAGYVTFLALSLLPGAGIGVAEVAGLTGLGVAIMLHSMLYHRRKLGAAPLVPEADLADQSSPQNS